ncbi:hypothetical protein CBS147339_3170 [Penicillium roqueforti]|nr:hypothetical protein CBS147339_3170 [Penicillium roqueforti]KAI3089902.1 hypothetical protein CBS147338_9298 [Penicillium roqueforti]KAI3128512.1 hypothetical protein CBS147325_9815 [Penicillium roqueforti]KAI3150420.1 hypothetical protein DTO046C5_9517 [Penicillium roqueforti]KAI3188083.1 hypothetical protein DTO032C6_3243 [Penicillium roqueforti]
MRVAEKHPDLPSGSLVLEDLPEVVGPPVEAEQKIPSKALGDLNLEEVESIFEIQPLRSENEELGDEWDLRPILREEFQTPAAFDEFYDFLMKSFEYLDVA